MIFKGKYVKFYAKFVKILDFIPIYMSWTRFIPAGRTDDVHVISVCTTLVFTNPSVDFLRLRRRKLVFKQHFTQN